MIIAPENTVGGLQALMSETSSLGCPLLRTEEVLPAGPRRICNQYIRQKRHENQVLRWEKVLRFEGENSTDVARSSTTPAGSTTAQSSP